LVKRLSSHLLSHRIVKGSLQYKKLLANARRQHKHEAQTLSSNDIFPAEVTPVCTELSKNAKSALEQQRVEENVDVNSSVHFDDQELSSVDDSEGTAPEKLMNEFMKWMICQMVE